MERGKSVVIAGEEIRPDEIKVLREFKLPEGVAPGELDAAGDGEVLVVLDLASDDSLLAAGTAREVVNRVQKLRKKAGLSVGDPIQVFLNVFEGREALWGAVESEMDYILDTVGTNLQPVGGMGIEEELVIAEAVAVPLANGSEATFEVLIYRSQTGADGATTQFGKMQIDLCDEDYDEIDN